MLNEKELELQLQHALMNDVDYQVVNVVVDFYSLKSLKAKFEQSELCYSDDLKSFSKLNALNKRFRGLCEIVVNSVIANDLMGQYDTVIESLVEEKISNYPKHRIQLDTPKPNGVYHDMISLHFLNQFAQTHCMDFYIFYQILAYCFDIYPNNLFTREETIAFNQKKEVSLLIEKFSTLPDNHYTKFMAITRQWFCLNGHVMVIKKTGKDQFSFFDPNGGETFNFTAAALAELVYEKRAQYQATHMVFMDGQQYINDIRPKIVKNNQLTQIVREKTDRLDLVRREVKQLLLADSLDNQTLLTTVERIKPLLEKNRLESQSVGFSNSYLRYQYEGRLKSFDNSRLSEYRKKRSKMYLIDRFVRLDNQFILFNDNLYHKKHNEKTFKPCHPSSQFYKNIYDSTFYLERNRMLSPEQLLMHAEEFGLTPDKIDAYWVQFKADVIEQLETVHDLIIFLEKFDHDNCGLIFNLINSSQLQRLIKTPLQLEQVLSAVLPFSAIDKQNNIKTWISNSMSPHLIPMIQTAYDMRVAFRYLDKSVIAEVFQNMEQDLPTLVESMSDLADVLMYLDSEQRQRVMERLNNKLALIVSNGHDTAYDFHQVLSCLTPTQQTIIVHEMFKKIPDIVLEDLGSFVFLHKTLMDLGLEEPCHRFLDAFLPQLSRAYDQTIKTELERSIYRLSVNESSTQIALDLFSYEQFVACFSDGNLNLYQIKALHLSVDRETHLLNKFLNSNFDIQDALRSLEFLTFTKAFKADLCRVILYKHPDTLDDKNSVKKMVELFDVADLTAYQDKIINVLATELFDIFGEVIAMDMVACIVQHDEDGIKQHMNQYLLSFDPETKSSFNFFQKRKPTVDEIVNKLSGALISSNALNENVVFWIKRIGPALAAPEPYNGSFAETLTAYCNRLYSEKTSGTSHGY